MDYRLLARYLGVLTLAFAVLILPSAVCALLFREWEMVKVFVETAAAAVFVGGALFFLGRGAGNRLFQREALGLVGLGWLLAATVAALPYGLSGDVDAASSWFEAMSGLTTTGATALPDIEAMPKSLLFWRAFTHWIGGMGIIVLFVAVLPYLGVGGKQLFKSEAPGPDKRGYSPRIRDTATVLWKIYMGITAVQTVLLLIAGMSLYDALCHTFATVSTGGFSPKQASVGAYDSVFIESIIIVFMIIAGTNFGLFYLMSRGDWKAIFKDTEWRVYVSMLLVVAVLLTISLVAGAPAIAMDEYRAVRGEVIQPPIEITKAIRQSAFQAVAIFTGTGFGTANFEVWNYFAEMMLVLVMFVGGCGGSTAGGIKVIRVVILAKIAYHRIESTFRPKTYRPIRIGGDVIDDGMKHAITVFFVIYVGIFAFASMIMAGMGLPIVTAFSSVAATLNNVGPGLEFVGAAHDYALVPAPGKIVLSICMLMGRLELFSILVLFMPSFWKHS